MYAKQLDCYANPSIPRESLTSVTHLEETMTQGLITEPPSRLHLGSKRRPGVKYKPYYNGGGLSHPLLCLWLARPPEVIYLTK